MRLDLIVFVKYGMNGSKLDRIPDCQSCTFLVQFRHEHVMWHSLTCGTPSHVALPHMWHFLTCGTPSPWHSLTRGTPSHVALPHMWHSLTVALPHTWHSLTWHPSHVALPHMWHSLTMALPHTWHSLTHGIPSHVTLPHTWHSPTCGTPSHVALPHILNGYQRKGIYLMKLNVKHDLVLVSCTQGYSEG